MIIIDIACGTGSGKTTVVKEIIKRLPADEIALLSQDAYYKHSSHRYEETVRPMHIQFVEPSKHYAYIIVPQVAINILTQYIVTHLT